MTCPTNMLIFFGGYYFAGHTYLPIVPSFFFIYCIGSTILKTNKNKLPRVYSIIMTDIHNKCIRVLVDDVPSEIVLRVHNNYRIITSLLAYRFCTIDDGIDTEKTKRMKDNAENVFYGILDNCKHSYCLLDSPVICRMFFDEMYGMKPRSRETSCFLASDMLLDYFIYTISVKAIFYNWLCS